MSVNLDEKFSDVIEKIQNMTGRLVIIGVGKSGIIGKKIAATLASTGTPSFFVHPAEAYHGDLGMIKNNDIVLLISNSGETDEIIKLLPFFKSNGNFVVSFTGNLNSTLGVNSDTSLNIGVSKEACFLNLAPTSSTTCTLVMGDILAVILSKIKNFRPIDFARLHPGGSLGRLLLTSVSDVMLTQNIPVANSNSSFSTIVDVINCGEVGLCVIVDDANKLIGVITDGDIRRSVGNYSDLQNLIASDFMSVNPIVIFPNSKLIDAEQLIKLHKITSLIVVNDDNYLLGIYRKM